VGHNGLLRTSTDFFNWTNKTSGSTVTINSITYNGSSFVYVGNTGSNRISYDLDNWLTIPSTAANILGSVTSGNNIVFCGSSGAIFSNDNGIFKPSKSGTTSEIRALTYDNGTYVYGGVGGVLSTSTDAITWTARTSGTTSTINALSYYDNFFVYAGNSGVFGTSTNGRNWISYPASDTRIGSTSSAINSIVINSGNYFYGGAGGILFRKYPYTYNVETEFLTPNLESSISNRETKLYIKGD
jgi:hypothetical protein